MSHETTNVSPRLSPPTRQLNSAFRHLAPAKLQPAADLRLAAARGTLHGMSEEREERLAKNEVLFRTLNENIVGLAGTLGAATPYEFICECATSGCFERLLLTLGEYEAVRSDGTHFLIASGHEDIEVERVVAVHDAYVVVEKDGVAGLVALEEDPRA